MGIEAWILFLAVAFLLGYIIGHRHGKEEGYRSGIVFAPIEMRRRSLEKGRCAVCGTGVKPARGEGAEQNAGRSAEGAGEGVEEGAHLRTSAYEAAENTAEGGETR